MKIFIVCFWAIISCVVSLYANQHLVKKNQILLTNDGIFCDLNGELNQVDSIHYFYGDYIATQKPFSARQCGQCGSRIGPDGRCENQSCNNSGRNGPKERD